MGLFRRIASSLPAARVLVMCFFLQTLTLMSSLLGETPTTIPSYTCVPGPTNRMPRSCALYRPYVTASPVSNATREPVSRRLRSPLYGWYSKKMEFMTPSPFVWVRNSLL